MLKHQQLHKPCVEKVSQVCSRTAQLDHLTGHEIVSVNEAKGHLEIEQCDSHCLPFLPILEEHVCEPGITVSHRPNSVLLCDDLAEEDACNDYNRLSGVCLPSRLTMPGLLPFG